MGSRAIAVVCRDEGVGLARFGIEGLGALYTRTGRPFLDDGEPALARIRDAMSRAGLWEALESDWVVLDCELLPWSAKAMELIRRQYAAVGAAGGAALVGVGRGARGRGGARAGRGCVARPHARSVGRVEPLHARRTGATSGR